MTDMFDIDRAFDPLFKEESEETWSCPKGCGEQPVVRTKIVEAQRDATITQKLKCGHWIL